MQSRLKYLSLAILAFVLLGTETQAQVQTVLDGAYVREHNVTKRVIPYPHLRESDVMWTKRVWQVLDLREKMNHSFYYPTEDLADRKSLFGVIRYALDEGSIVAYGLGPAGDDDEFRYALSPSALDSLLKPTVIQYIDTNLDGEMEAVETVQEIEPSLITQYKLKEEWVFDKQRSERYVRIIGIAPMIESFDESGNFRGYQDLFWLYFPECRYVFANWDVFNRQNDSQRRTYEDLFQQRMFSSYVVKESNVYDRSIVEYAKGVDALLESERIKEDLFLLEHDLWHY